ncbi:tetratricopeptide repeat protein [Herpetosiphon sp. NSE202]|uniref:tetratricopeptide repeat protein n=1 Tax=Herpetosiphon sp. NSE202 TaxID=3351349 RepID=UPI00363C7B1C
MQIAALLSEARNALRGGDRAKAKQLASQALRLDSKHVETWLFLAEVVEASEQKRDCFQRVLAFDPTNAAAKQGLQLLDAPAEPPAPPAVASVELPESAWFGNQAVASPPTSSTIATPPLPTSPPSTGIRPLAQASTPSLAELSNLPASMPAAPSYAQPIQAGYAQPPQIGYVQPIQAGYTQPNQGYAPPMGQQGQMQGQVAYPHVQPSGAAKVLKWLVFATLGLVALCIGFAYLSNAVKTPPPTPKVSAQDRTTAMIDAMIKMVANPQTYTANGAQITGKPLVEKYFSKPYRVRSEQSATEMIMGLNAATDNSLGSIAPLIAKAYVTPIEYEVISEDKDKQIKLRIISGEMVIITKDNRIARSPLTSMYESITLVNEDGIWYAHDVEDPN